MIVYCLLTYIIYDIFGTSVNSSAATYIRKMYMQNKWVYVFLHFLLLLLKKLFIENYYLDIYMIYIQDAIGVSGLLHLC